MDPMEPVTETEPMPEPDPDALPQPDITEQRTESGIILPDPTGHHIGAISFINGRTSPFSIDAPVVLKQWHTTNPDEVVDKVAAFIQRECANAGGKGQERPMLRLLDPMYGYTYYVTTQGMREAQTIGHGWANEIDPNAMGGMPQIIRAPASAMSQFSGGDFRSPTA